MDTILVSKSEFKAKALEYFRQVEASGTSIIVTDHGKPTLEVRPYSVEPIEPMHILRSSVLKYNAPMQPVGESDWDAE